MNFTEISIIVDAELQRRNAMFLSPALVHLNTSIPWHWLGEVVPLSKELRKRGIRLVIDPVTEEILMVRVEHVNGDLMRTIVTEYTTAQSAGSAEAAPPV